MGKLNPKHIGSDLNDFLTKEGIKDEVEAAARARVAAMQQPMTDDELAAIRARTEAATPGPWDAVKLYDVTDTTYIEGCDFGFNGDINVEVERAGLEYPEWVMIGPESPQQKQIHADAEFIAHARTDIPALLAEVERLRKITQFTHWR